MMWQKLIKSSVGAFLSTVPVGYYLMLFTLAGVLCGGYINGLRWQHKYDALVNTQQSQVLQAQAAASQATQANASATGTIDTQKYQELQNAKNTINDLRSQLRTGAISVRDCATGTDNAKTRTSISMGDGQAPESTGRGQSAGQDILDLAEIAKTAIAQRNYLQDKHVADTKTVNGN